MICKRRRRRRRRRRRLVVVGVMGVGVEQSVKVNSVSVITTEYYMGENAK